MVAVHPDFWPKLDREHASCVCRQRDMLRDGFLYKMTRLPQQTQTLTLTANAPVTKKEKSDD
jgi:hypothetical protein